MGVETEVIKLVTALLGLLAAILGLVTTLAKLLLAKTQGRKEAEDNTEPRE